MRAFPSAVHRWMAAAAVLGLAAGGALSASAAPVKGQIDNFTSGLQNWDNGAPAAGPNLLLGGPSGAADQFMQLTANGGSSGGKLTVFDRSTEWTGNWST